MSRPAFVFSIPSSQDLLPRVVRQVGYPSSRAVGRTVLSEIRRVIRQGRDLARANGRYRTDPLTGCGDGLLWVQDARIRSVRWERLARRLPEPRVICRFVVTLGKELDEQIQQTQEESMFSAYLLDAVGSVLAECLADQMESSLADILRGQGLQATGRFSPGYCDWEIRGGQTAIFNDLQPETIGVTCTSSGMMIPRKSISACLLGAREVVQRYPCGFCSRSGCEYRRQDGRREGAGSFA